MAPTIGVQPDVLYQAWKRHKAEAEAAGIQPALGAANKYRGHKQLYCPMPEHLWHRWHEWAEQQGLKSSAALRSLAYAYLLGSWEPRWRSKYWPGPDGRAMKLAHRAWEREHGGLWPYTEKALVSQGAYGALRRRGDRIGLPLLSLTRGIVLEALSGRIRSVMPIDARAMPNDPDRYPMPPLEDES